MPKVIMLGTTYNDFWDLNPRKVNVMVKAYNEARKSEIRQSNMLMHVQGMYIVDALLATVGNMFKDRSHVPFEYPKEPYTLDLEYEEGLDMEDEENRELAIQRRDFVTNLNNLFRDIDRTLKEKDDAEHS